MKRTIASLAALCALAALAAAAPPATAATQTTTYAANGDYSASICEGGLCFNQTYTYAGQLSCLSGCSATTQAGSLTINLVTQKLIPQDPIIPVDPVLPQDPLKASGTFSIAWADATTTSGTLSGHSIPPKGIALTGQVTASTNAFIPQEPTRGFVTLGEASTGPFTGSLTLRTISG